MLPGVLRLRRACLPMVAGLVASAMTLTGAVPAAPAAADPRLEEAKERREQRQADLDEGLARIHALEASIEATELELETLASTEQGHRAAAERAASRVGSGVRASYMHGQPDPVWALLTADDVAVASEQARLLGALARRQKISAEEAVAASTDVAAVAERSEALLGKLADRRAELEEARQEASRTLAEAEERVDDVRATIRREEAEERRRREARARAQAAADRSSRSASSGGSTSGSIACPVGQPRSYSNTYGAGRSGGRSHKGTDILAPRGTHIYAYEAGTVSRMHSNRLGGVVLYLRGDSGNSYYYAHLQGYVSGLSTGQRVRAGQHIAFNGDTGNATGIPHLHIEVFPGGGGNANPYPYMRRACG